jgi:hypothetical protein
MAALTIDDGPSLSPATSAKRNPYQNIASTTRNSFEDQSKDTREPHTLVTTSTWHQHHAEEAATHNSPPKKRKPPPPASKGGLKKFPPPKLHTSAKILKAPPKLDSKDIKVIQPWHAVLGDKQSGLCTTQATVIFKEVKKEFKANNKHKSVKYWARKAHESFLKRINDEFKDVPEFQAAPSADRGRILVKCSPQAIKGKRVKEKEYSYNGDKEDSYGNANLPIALPFELRSPNSTDLGDELKIYEEKFKELETCVGKPPKSDMDTFKDHLETLKRNNKKALHGDSLGKNYVKHFGKIKALQEFWQELTTLKPGGESDLPDQPSGEVEGANTASAGDGANLLEPMDFNDNPIEFDGIDDESLAILSGIIDSPGSGSLR